MIIIRRVIGSSMEPTLNHGQIVIGLRPIKDIKLKQVVIFHHQGKEKIKRISELHEDKIYVQGDNPGHSTDSRHFGALTQKNIIARLIWPRTTSRRTYL